MRHPRTPRHTTSLVHTDACDQDDSLDLYMRSDLPPSPPPPPHGPRSGHTGNALHCDAMLNNPHDKFYRMWGGSAWWLTEAGGGDCWGANPAAFFSHVEHGDWYVIAPCCPTLPAMDSS